MSGGMAGLSRGEAVFCSLRDSTRTLHDEDGRLVSSGAEKGRAGREEPGGSHGAKPKRGGAGGVGVDRGAELERCHGRTV